MRIYIWLMLIMTLVATHSSHGLAAIRIQVIRPDLDQARSWNSFADALYKLHQTQISKITYTTKTTRGGYPDNPDYYVETHYFDKVSGRLLSRVLREASDNEKIHVVEVFIYDQQGKVMRDYSAAYLPIHRNAPSRR